jgi:4-hydroxybenzoate polyprenyltransferase
MRNRISKTLEWFRVKDWFHYLGYIFLGSLASNDLNLTTFLLGSSMLAFAFSLNDYFDKKLRKKMFIFPLFLSFSFLPFLGEFQLIFYFSFILIFILYSWPVTYLEGKAFFSILSNSLGFLLIFFLPFKNPEKILKLLDFSLLLFFLNAAAQIIHEIVHYKEDKKTRKITTTVRFGIKNSIRFLKTNLILIILISFFLFPKFKLISISTFFFSAYFFFLSCRKINIETRKKFRYFGILCGIIYSLDFARLE